MMAVDSTKYETHFYGPVQGVVIGDDNTVTLILQSGERLTVPFLAPPPPPHELVGRDDVLDDLKLRLFAGGSLALSVLNGLPGVGKTALAVALAHNREVLEYFRDGVLWAGLGRKGDAFALLGSWAVALGISSDEIAKLISLDERAKAIRYQIGMRHMLLVVDDAWQSEAALAFKVGGPNCAHLVTTRLPEVAVHFAGEGVSVVHELSETDSLALLARLAPEVTEAEPDIARDLVRAVGGLPLGLILMGNYLRVQALSDQPRRIEAALEQLYQVEERLQVSQPQSPLERHPSLPSGASISLHAVIAISDKALDEAARRTLRALSTFPPKPNTFSEEAALAVTAEPTETLDTLTDFGLLETSGPGRYTLHQTISDYARHEAASDETAHQRMVKFFVDYAKVHERNHNALGLEIDNILTALEIASGWEEHPPIIIATVVAFCDFLRDRGLYTPVQSHLDWAKQSAQSSGNDVGLAYILCGLGAVEADLGNYARASELQHQGLKTAREAGHKLTIAHVLTNLSALTVNFGNYERAYEYLQEALALAREIQDDEIISYCLMHLGTIATHQGDLTRAKQLYQEGLTISREISHREGTANFLANLGGVAFKIGDIDHAEQCFTEALDLAQEVKLREIISSTLLNLGVIVGYRGDYVQAEGYIRRSLDIAHEIGHKPRIADIRHALGELYLQQQDLDSAILAFEDTLKMARELGMQELIGCALDRLARIAAAQGDIPKAYRQGQESLVIFEAMGHSSAAQVKEWLDGLPAVNSAE